MKATRRWGILENAVENRLKWEMFLTCLVEAVRENVKIVQSTGRGLHYVKDHLIKVQMIKWYSKRVETTKAKGTNTTR